MRLVLCFEAVYCLGLPAMKNNCLFYAFWLWLRHGGYLVIRRSHFGPFPHFIWVAKLPALLPARQWVPGAPEKRCCPPLIFNGTVKTQLGAAPAAGFQWGLLLFWTAYFTLVLVALGYMLFHFTYSFFI